MRTKKIAYIALSLYSLTHALIILAIYHSIYDEKDNETTPPIHQRIIETIKYSFNIPITILSIIYYITRKPE